MQRLLLGLVIAASATAWGKDLVLHQSVTRTDAATVDETFYVTDHRLVTDSPATTTIVDASTATVTVIAKPHRSYMVTSFDALDQLRKDDVARWNALPSDVRERTQNAFGTGTPVVLTATGKTEAIAGTEATEYAVAGGSLSGSIWLAKNTPLPDVLRQRRWFARPDATLGVWHELAHRIGTLEGLVLRAHLTETLGPRVTTQTLEVRDLREGALPAETVTIPPGFEEQKRPTTPVAPAP